MAQLLILPRPCPINLLKRLSAFLLFEGKVEWITMKINDTNRVNGINPYQKTVETNTANSVKRSQKKDEVSISAEALEMLRAQQSGDVEKTKKIEELKKLVSSGTYHVEAQDLADKLLPYFKNIQQD
jgi:flagellar biosynthesis anti-sigma factor FlgM